MKLQNASSTPCPFSNIVSHLTPRGFSLFYFVTVVFECLCKVQLTGVLYDKMETFCRIGKNIAHKTVWHRSTARLWSSGHVRLSATHTYYVHFKISIDASFTVVVDTLKLYIPRVSSTLKCIRWFTFYTVRNCVQCILIFWLGMTFDEALCKETNQLSIQFSNGCCSTCRNWRSEHTSLVTWWRSTFPRISWLTHRLLNSMNRCVSVNRWPMCWNASGLGKGGESAGHAIGPLAYWIYHKVCIIWPVWCQASASQLQSVAVFWRVPGYIAC